MMSFLDLCCCALGGLILLMLLLVPVPAPEGSEGVPLDRPVRFDLSFPVLFDASQTPIPTTLDLRAPERTDGKKYVNVDLLLSASEVDLSISLKGEEVWHGRINEVLDVRDLLTPLGKMSMQSRLVPDTRKWIEDETNNSDHLRPRCRLLITVLIITAANEVQLENADIAVRAIMTTPELEYPQALHAAWADMKNVISSIDTPEELKQRDQRRLDGTASDVDLLPMAAFPSCAVSVMPEGVSRSAPLVATPAIIRWGGEISSHQPPQVELDRPIWRVGFTSWIEGFPERFGEELNLSLNTTLPGAHSHPNEESNPAELNYNTNWWCGYQETDPATMHLPTTTGRLRFRLHWVGMIDVRENPETDGGTEARVKLRVEAAELL